MIREAFCLCFIALTLPALAESFDKTLTAGDASFRITATNSADGNKVTVSPKGLKNSNDPVSFEADGELTKTILEDMNGDDLPELFLVFTGAGSGSHGQVKAFSTNGGKSLTDIVIAEPAGADMEGYMGHDEFEVVENTFIRRFPIYKAGDSNANPTGGWRQIQYKLAPGEATWHLRVDRVASY